MSGSEGDMSLAEMAAELGVARQTVQKWHKTPKQAGADTAPAALSALQSVAHAMGVKTDGGPRYPRAVFVAFAKAVGYFDAEGNLVQELQDKPAARWLPVAPTIEPGPRQRRRFYKNHAAAKLGLAENTVKVGARFRDWFPDPDGQDEMKRIYWFETTLDAYATARQAAKDRKSAGPAPDGHLENGQPFWTTPPGRRRRQTRS